jgi:hypothetical protein
VRGWLAASGPGDSLQVGVTAPSETEALAKFTQLRRCCAPYIS